MIKKLSYTVGMLTAGAIFGLTFVNFTVTPLPDGWVIVLGTVNMASILTYFVFPEKE